MPERLSTRLIHRLRLDDPAVREALQQFCETHHLLSLSVFGSVLRDDFREGGDDPSDVDVLVELDPNHIPGWEYYSWGDELTELWDRKTEVMTSEELSRQYRDRVLKQAVTLYERERPRIAE